MTSVTKMVDVRFECVQCGVCCSQKEIIVTVTGRDIARIASGLGLFPQQMLKVIDFYIATKDEHLPRGLQDVPQVMTERGPAIIALKKLNTNECIFLKDNLCMIHPIRPGACRAFPFVFSKNESEINWGLNAKQEICPGLGQGEIVKTEELLSLAHEVLEDISITRMVFDEWNKSQEDPTTIQLLETILNDIRFNV
jgi:Fe-S-cluster containining protein